MTYGLSLQQWQASGERVPIELRGTSRSIFVRAVGAGDDAILFLHGFPTSSWDWHKIEALLSAGRKLVFFDFLGYGASDKPSRHRYDLCEQADLAEAVARYASLREAYVVAHDYGSSVAQELLARDAEGSLSFRLRGVTLLNGGVYPDLHRPVAAQRLLRSPLGPAFSLLAGRKRMTAALASVFAPARKPSGAELAMHWEAIAQRGGNRIGHLLIRYIDDRLVHERRWVDALETTRVPLRFAWGMQDPVSGAHVMQRLRERVEGRALLVELQDAGHYPQLEVPQRVAEVIGRV